MKAKEAAGINIMFFKLGSLAFQFTVIMWLSHE